MSMFSRKSGAAAPLLLDYRTDAKLVAARARRAEIATLLANLEGHDVRVAQEAVAEADRRLDEAEIQSLSGRLPDSELAKVQADVLAAKRTRALVTVHVDDLRKEAAKLDAVTIPDLDYKAKQTARDNLQAETLQTLKALEAALVGVPNLAARLKDLRQLAAEQFPWTHASADPSHDYRFSPAVGVPLIAVSERVIRYGSGGQRWADTNVTMPDEATIPILNEVREGIRVMEDAIAKR